MVGSCNSCHRGRNPIELANIVIFWQSPTIFCPKPLFFAYRTQPRPPLPPASKPPQKPPTSPPLSGKRKGPGVGGGMSRNVAVRHHVEPHKLPSPFPKGRGRGGVCPGHAAPSQLLPSQNISRISELSNSPGGIMSMKVGTKTSPTAPLPFPKRPLKKYPIFRPNV